MLEAIWDTFEQFFEYLRDEFGTSWRSLWQHFGTISGHLSHPRILGQGGWGKVGGLGFPPANLLSGFARLLLIAATGNTPSLDSRRHVSCCSGRHSFAAKSESRLPGSTRHRNPKFHIPHPVSLRLPPL